MIIYSAGCSDACALKSDFHGVEMEVVKSRCYSFVGLRGVVVKESFSAFVLAEVASDTRTKLKSTHPSASGSLFSQTCLRSGAKERLYISSAQGRRRAAHQWRPICLFLRFPLRQKVQVKELICIVINARMSPATG